MDEMMKIHVLIDGERYPMTIRREEEELYRAAANLINNRLNETRSSYPQLPPHRHWAMIALMLAYKNLSMKDQNDTAPYTRKLEELTQEIEAYISRKE